MTDIQDVADIGGEFGISITGGYKPEVDSNNGEREVDLSELSDVEVAQRLHEALEARQQAQNLIASHREELLTRDTVEEYVERVVEAATGHRSVDSI